MTSTRKTAVIVGLLFLTQTVAFIIAEQLITGVLTRPNYLAGVSADANTLTLGGLFAVVSGVAVVGIAVLLFPLLKPTSEPLALGYVCERVIELVLQLLFFLVVPLLMIAIGNGLRDGTVAASASASLGPILKALHDQAIVVLYLVTSVGGTILSVLLYRSGGCRDPRGERRAGGHVRRGPVLPVGGAAAGRRGAAGLPPPGCSGQQRRGILEHPARHC